MGYNKDIITLISLTCNGLTLIHTDWLNECRGNENKPMTHTVLVDLMTEYCYEAIAHEPTQSYFRIWSILYHFVWFTYLFLSGLSMEIQPKWDFCLEIKP